MKGICQPTIQKEWCMHVIDELFLRSKLGYFGDYFTSCEAVREMDTKMTLQWATKKFVASVSE